MEVKDGQLFVEPYEYYDRDAMFTCTPEVLLKIAEGKMNPVTAFTMQKLKVEGNFDKALRFKDIVEMKREKRVERKRRPRSKKRGRTHGSTEKDCGSSRTVCGSRNWRNRIFLQPDHETGKCENGTDHEDVRNRLGKIFSNDRRTEEICAGAAS